MCPYGPYGLPINQGLCNSVNVNIKHGLCSQYDISFSCFCICTGYVYLLFESEKAVRGLLQDCTHDFSSGDYYFKISSRRMRAKEVKHSMSVHLSPSLSSPTPKKFTLNLNIPPSSSADPHPPSYNFSSGSDGYVFKI